MANKYKTMREIKTFVFLLIIISLWIVEGKAQDIPPPIKLQVPQIKQKDQFACWLAVCEMVIKYHNKGNSPNQYEIYEMMHNLYPGTCKLSPQSCTRPGGLNEIQVIISNFCNKLSFIDIPNDPMTLYERLENGSVVIVALRLTPFMGHVIIVRGMRFVPMRYLTHFGPQIYYVPMVLINDPMSHFSSQIPYITLIKHWFGSIIVEP